MHKSGNCLLIGAALPGFIAFIAQNPVHEHADVGFIINNQDFMHHRQTLSYATLSRDGASTVLNGKTNVTRAPVPGQSGPGTRSARSIRPA